MIGALIGLLLLCLVLGLVVWAIQQLLPLIPLGEPFHTIVRVLIVLIVALIALYVILDLLSAAGVAVPLWSSRLR
jgi:hypothetical protein